MSHNLPGGGKISTFEFLTTPNPGLRFVVRNSKVDDLSGLRPGRDESERPYPTQHDTRFRGRTTRQIDRIHDLFSMRTRL